MAEAAPEDSRAGYPSFFYIPPFSPDAAAPESGQSSNVEFHEP